MVISDSFEPVYFSLDTASFLCPKCAKKELNIVQISHKVGSIWRECQHSAPQDFLKEKSVFFHNFKDLDRIISVIVKQVFHQDFASLAEIVL
jgi:recombinational DNA repair protein (RecF pathway)